MKKTFNAGEVMNIVLAVSLPLLGSFILLAEPLKISLEPTIETHKNIVVILMTLLGVVFSMSKKPDWFSKLVLVSGIIILVGSQIRETTPLWQFVYIAGFSAIVSNLVKTFKK